MGAILRHFYHDLDDAAPAFSKIIVRCSNVFRSCSVMWSDGRLPMEGQL